jgi:hypothetical protein
MSFWKTYTRITFLCVVAAHLLSCALPKASSKSVSESERVNYRITAKELTIINNKAAQKPLNYTQVVYAHGGHYVLCIPSNKCDTDRKEELRSSDALNILAFVAEQEVQYVSGKQRLIHATYFPTEQGTKTTITVMQGRSTVGACTVILDIKRDNSLQYSERCDITVTALKNLTSRETEPRGITTTGRLLFTPSHELIEFDGVAVFDTGGRVTFNGKKE